FSRPVLSFGNLAFELVVGNRVIFYMDGHTLVSRIEAGSLGYGPPFHRAIQFQPEVVMQAPGPVFLYNTSRGVCICAAAGRRLGRRRAVSFRLVLVEGVGARHGPFLGRLAAASG